MNIILLEPYFSGSHKTWALDLQKYSRHTVTILDMPGRFWKWRMQASAVEMADRLNKSNNNDLDIILCSTMLDVGLLKALIKKEFSKTPVLYYLHENQLTYPMSHKDRDKLNPDYNYGFLNYKSCLAADHCIFNSEWHRDCFFSALAALLRRMPDFQNDHTVDILHKKSFVLPVGIDVQHIRQTAEDYHARHPRRTDPPVLLYNHRWEHDKNPELFVQLCDDLAKQHEFRINFIGQHHTNTPEYLDAFHERHKSRILHWGYVRNYNDYLAALAQSDLMPVTSDHDFFGISVLEACYAGVHPILPRDMVYTEHFKNKHAQPLIYQDYDDLYRLTSKLIKAVSTNAVTRLDTSAIYNYDVREVYATYDTFFDTLAGPVP